VTQMEGVALPDGKALEDLQPKEIIRVMVRINQLRRAKVADLEQLTAELGQARKNALLAQAAAFIDHSGPAAERAQVGKKAGAEAERLVEVAKGKLEACRERLRILKDDWDTCRSANSNERADRNATEGFGS
jgi:hypothetical protein